MKVGWVADHCPAEMSVMGGGAEQNDWGMVKQGIRQGHEIDLLTPQNFGTVNFDAYDLFIISNCKDYPQYRLEKIMQHKYVVFNHDFMFCRWRLYFQADEKCKQCSYLPFWKKFYSNAKLNIFLSPYHKEMHEKVLGKIKLSAIVPSAINVEEFKPSKAVKPEKGTVCACNSLYPFKGKDQVLEYIKKHKGKKFTLYGANPDDAPIPKNATYKGFVPNSKMPAEYQKHEALLHLPANDPFCRVVAEFLLSNPRGKLIANDNIGVLSYFKEGKVNRKKLKELIKSAPTKFWQEVGKVIE